MWPGAAKAKAGGGMRRPCSRPAHRHRHPSLSSPLLQFGPGPAPVLDGVPGGCRRLALCRGCGRASHLCRRHPAASRQGERWGWRGWEGRSHPRVGGEETWVGARGAPRVARPPARPARPPAQPGLPPSATFKGGTPPHTLPPLTSTPVQRWHAVLHSPVWDAWRRRFAYCGVVPSVPYCAPDKQYVFAHFPHAVFPMGSFMSFPLCGDVATGVPAPMEGLVATVLLRVPFFKHIFAWKGCYPAGAGCSKRGWQGQGATGALALACRPATAPAPRRLHRSHPPHPLTHSPLCLAY